MIYDIGMAYGKEKVLDRELLAGIFSYALGQKGVGLLTVQGGKIVVQRVTIKVFEKLIPIMGNKVGQIVFKSLVGKCLPVVGVIAMAAWSKYSTREVGKKATTIVKQPIEYSAVVSDNIPFNQPEPETDRLQKTDVSDSAKIKAFINLIKIDGKVELKERQYINLFVTNSNLRDADKVSLLMSIDDETQFSIDYTQFVNSPDDAVGLLIDLIALAQHDGEFHIKEKIYIKQVGKSMGIAESDIEAMMVTC